jgi:large repetitive protein
MNSPKRKGPGRVVAVLAAMWVLASATYGAEIPLTNGVPLTGLSGIQGSEVFYKIQVPAGQDQLEILTTGGTGDVDFYVRRDALPTTTSWDYRPYKPGNEEREVILSPAAGTWYIMLRGYNAYSGVTLKATYSSTATVVALTNGLPVTSLAGTAGSDKYFKIDVPAGQSKLEIVISGGTGDADLYIRRGSLPTTTLYDYRPYLTGNEEGETISTPAAGTWYIMIRGFTAYAGLTLLASYSGAASTGTELQNGVAVTGLSGTQASEKIFRIDVPAGQTNLLVAMWGGSGDADLYIKFGARPTTTDYDRRPFLAGNDETENISNPTAGTWYIMVRGFYEYSGVSLKASFGETIALQDEVPVVGLSGPLGSEIFFKIEVPSGETSLEFTTSGGTGNVDMYIRRGSRPTTASWDYRGNDPGNNQTVSISNPASGTWYVMLKATQAYTGVTLVADYYFIGTVVLLSNSVPVTNISGGEGSQRYYRLVVPGNQGQLEVKIFGGSGDADLYIKAGSLPTASEYDYRPYQSGNNESQIIPNPAGVDWFMMIRGHAAYSGVTLVATFGSGTTPPPDVITLQNDVPVSGINGTIGSERFYKIDVPAGQAKLEISIAGGTGDADMYIRHGAKPTTLEWDYRPYLIGNNEVQTIDNPAAGTWFIMLRGYTTYSNVTLKATYTGVPETVTPLTNGVPVPALSGAAGSEKFYKIDVPAGQSLLTVEISGGTGDADLYIKKGAKPTTGSWDYRPYLIGNNEKQEIVNPAAATWYIMLHGYLAYTGVTLKATYTGSVGNNFAVDPNCVALWRFESGKLTMDSIGTNTLTNFGVDPNTADYQEGSASAYFVNAQQDRMQIPDANLSARFPLRTADTNKRISVACWFKAKSLSTIYGEAGGTSLFSKYDVDKMSFNLRVTNDGRIAGHIGITDGTSYRFFTDTSTVIVPGRWYHVAVTFNDADGSYCIRVFDKSAGTAAETVGTLPFNISGKDGTVRIGAHRYAWQNWDGLIDEMAVFNDILTPAEIDKIRQGTYGKP